VNQVLTDAWRTLVPASDDKHGPLVPMMVGLTVVTGLVDAFSYLALGHVFVANMTGNVIFLAFALVGARGFSFLASLAAIAAFSCGALVGGRVSARIGHNRGRHLVVVTSLEAVLVGASALLAGLAHTPGSGAPRYVLIVVLSVALGTQNAAVRKLAIPDLTTTVLTLTITGISADSRLAGGGGSKAGRRLVSALAMFVGALIGALLVLKVNRVGATLVALGVLLAIVVTTALLSRSEPDWVHPPA
jgi:uncharacterized membrane protein YoaK (UPF0700 family)